MRRRFSVIYANPPSRQDGDRLAAPKPGAGPVLRSPGVQYRRTGFIRPANSSVSGASALPLRVLRSAARMPDNFRWLPSDLVHVLDQGDCGSCWAHAVAECLSDRVSAMSKGKTKATLSVRMIQECSPYLSGTTAGGCDGNDTYTAIKGLVDSGVMLRSDQDYARQYQHSSVDVGQCDLPKAQDQTYGVTVSQAFLISDVIQTPGDAVNVANVENIKQHIYHEGPVVGSFRVYKDFYDYDGLTIYEPKTTEEVGFHAIEMVGWGVEPKTKVGYWICRNSWGEQWPTSHYPCAGMGWFYIKMGFNVCEIESYVAGAIPVVANADRAPSTVDDTYSGDSCQPASPRERGGGDEVEKKTSTGANTVMVVAGVAAVALLIAAITFMMYNGNKRKR